LVRRFLQGEAGDVARVEARIVRAVHYRGYYVPAQDCGDLVQEVLLEVYEALGRPGFRFTEGFGAFVRSIAYRRCVDWVRRRRAHDPIDPQTPAVAMHPDQRIAEEEQKKLALEILGSLPGACRELIRLHAGARLTYREIARRLGRSEGALRTQMCECLKEARKALQRRVGARGPEAAGRRDARES